MKTATADFLFPNLPSDKRSPFGELFADIKIEWAQHFAPTFSEHNQPSNSCISITLNFFFHASYHYFEKDTVKAKHFMKENIFDILMFSEVIREQVGVGENGWISESRLEHLTRVIQVWVKSKSEGKNLSREGQIIPTRWQRFWDWLLRRKISR